MVGSKWGRLLIETEMIAFIVLCSLIENCPFPEEYDLAAAETDVVLMPSTALLDLVYILRHVICAELCDYNAAESWLVRECFSAHGAPSG